MGKGGLMEAEIRVILCEKCNKKAVLTNERKHYCVSHWKELKVEKRHET